MKKAKHYLTNLSFLVVFAMFGLFSSCSKNDNSTPTFANPTISVTPTSPQQSPGNVVTFSIAVTADAGLASVDLNGTNIKSYTTDTKTDAFSYDYTVPADQALGSATLTFTVTDKQTTAKTASAGASLTVTANPIQTVTIENSISTNQTWTASNHYLLKGNIYVESGAELTIKPGTLIFGDKATKGALVISRGGKIHAVGTPDSVIIFTSTAPKGFRNYGDWGGVILLGKAPNNQSTSQAIEGITPGSGGGDNGLYGGTDDNDNSGEFEYCRIEFAGIALSTDNEINGLTFGSVGRGTKIDHVQVSYSGDDSYEWFGGSVTVSYLVAFRGWDDEYDTDFGFHGTGQFLVSYRDPNQADKSQSNGFESDNDAQGDDNTPTTTATFANVSFFGPYVFAALSGGGALNPSNVNNNYAHGAHIRRNSALQVYNCAFVGQSKLDGVYFQNTNASAVFKGNYIGRITGPELTVTPKTTNPYDTTGFHANNWIENPISKVDLSDKWAGLSGVSDLTNPPALLAAGSPLLTAGTTLPDNPYLIDKTVQYVGAFDDSHNWLTGWTNFDPNNTDY